jgi:hypothetical protein
MIRLPKVQNRYIPAKAHYTLFIVHYSQYHGSDTIPNISSTEKTELHCVQVYSVVMILIGKGVSDLQVLPSFAYFVTIFVSVFVSPTTFAPQFLHFFLTQKGSVSLKTFNCNFSPTAN